jgi:hypothetical protein
MTKIKFLYILLIPLAGIIVYTNQKVDSVSERPTAAASKPSGAVHTAIETTGNLAVADPEEFGINMQASKSGRTPDEWASHMQETLSEESVVASMDQQGILEELRRNPQGIEEKLQRVKEDIGQQEIKVRQRPNDADEENRLQSLYMLKAMLTTLREKIAPANPNQQ